MVYNENFRFYQRYPIFGLPDNCSTRKAILTNATLKKLYVALVRTGVVVGKILCEE